MHENIQIPTTGYVGLIWCSTGVATASWRNFEGTLQALWQEYLYAVATAYPQQYSQLQ